MLERLAHRGPDDAGEVGSATRWLGHRRLSIVDVEGGRQPLGTPTASVWLVGNGEVYNHEDVRATLERRGVPHRAPTTRSRCTCSTQRGPAALARAQRHVRASCRPADDGALRRRPRPGRHQAAVLGAAERHGRCASPPRCRLRPRAGRPRVEPFPPGRSWTPEGGLQRFAAVGPGRPGSAPEPPSREAQRAAHPRDAGRAPSSAR